MIPMSNTKFTALAIISTVEELTRAKTILTDNKLHNNNLTPNQTDFEKKFIPWRIEPVETQQHLSTTLSGKFKGTSRCEHSLPTHSLGARSRGSAFSAQVLDATHCGPLTAVCSLQHGDWRWDFWD